MSAVWAVTRRELQAYFVSPIAYAFMTVFLVLIAVGFYIGVERYMKFPAAHLQESGVTIRSALIAGRFGLVRWAHTAILVCLPGLSMRLFTEERKSGTSELLFTSPLTTWQLILGKYLGTVGVYVVILAASLPMPFFLGAVAKPEWAAIGAAYLGLFLHGAFLLAIGLFASTLTENQFIALILTYTLLVPMYLVELLIGYLGDPFDSMLAALAVTSGVRTTATGVIESHYLVLWLAYSFLFLFLGGRVLESGRWR